jgi:hypothetical protein
LAEGRYGHVLSVKASAGFVPLNMPGGSHDNRFLGVLMQVQGVARK